MSQPVSPSNGYIPPITPSFVADAQPEYIDDQGDVIEEVNRDDPDTSIKKPDDLLEKFDSLSEDMKRQLLERGVKIIQIQSKTLSRIEEGTKEIRADLDSMGRTLRSLDAPGGPLDPVRLKEQDEAIQRAKENTEEQRKVTEQQKKDLEEQRKVTEQQRKDLEEQIQKEAARQARWNRFKYIVGFGWLYDGAQLTKDVAYRIFTCGSPLPLRPINHLFQEINNNSGTLLKVGIFAAGAVFFLRLAINNYQTILQYKTRLLPSTWLGAAALIEYPMLIKKRIPAYLGPNSKEINC